VVTASAHLGQAGETRDRHLKSPCPHLSVGGGNAEQGGCNEVRNDILTSEVRTRREHEVAENPLKR